MRCHVWRWRQQQAVTDWAKIHGGAFDSLGRGGSALDAAATRAAKSELEVALGECVANALWDSEKFLDKVSIPLKLRET